MPRRVPSSRGLRRGAALVAFALALVACTAEPVAEPPDPGAAAHMAAGSAPTPPQIPDDAPTVAFLGDSIAAGLHLARHEAFPAVLQRRLTAAGRPFHLVNAGVSGDTTAGGLARVDWVMRRAPQIVVVELGANDGLRGQPLDAIEANLRAIVAGLRERGARVLLLGMRLPPNYGPDYTSGFATLYERVADDLDVAAVPFFMEGVAGEPDLNLPDGLHPTPAGHERLARNVEAQLTRLLAELLGQ